MVYSYGQHSGNHAYSEEIFLVKHYIYKNITFGFGLFPLPGRRISRCIPRNDVFLQKWSRKENLHTQDASANEERFYNGWAGNPIRYMNKNITNGLLM
jgi:hypothetical protein